MKISYVSASQVDAFKNCQRYWFLGWVKKIKFPPSAAMVRGTLIHAEAEYTVGEGGIIRPTPFTPYIESMLPHLPIGEKDVLREKKFDIPARGSVKWTGFIDLVEAHCDPLRITDYKTTSDFRYAKTPMELSVNTQLISYARWAYVVGHKGPIELRHFYIKTAKKTPKKPKIKLVDVVVDEEHVNKVWERDVLIIDDMQKVALLEDPNAVTPNTLFCPKYGGCPHRGTKNCIILPEHKTKPNWATTNKKKDELMSNSFLDKLKTAKNLAAGNKEEPPKESPKKATKKATKKTPPATKKSGSLAERLAAKKAGLAKAKTKEEPNEGVLPPDAPPRETKPAEAAEPEETETEAAAQPKEEPKKRTRKRKKETEGFTLYIDCMPMKGDTDVPLFEDWVAPIVAKINEETMEEKGLPTYQLLPYSEEKAIFSMAIQEAVKEIPSALLINSSSVVAKEALAVLVPHAQKVVRAFR